MKIVGLTLLALVVTVYAAPTDDLLAQCLDEHNIKDEELAQLLQEKDPKAHCLIACTLEKDGLLKHGELNRGAIIKDLVSLTTKVSEADLTKMYDSCFAEVKHVSDICAVTNDLINCIHRELVKLGV